MEMSDELLQYFDDLVLKSRNRPLNDGEKYVLRGIWMGKSYEEMVADSQGEYSKNYLMQSCGPKILKTIGQKLKLSLNKGNFRATVEKEVKLATKAQIAQPNLDSEEATEVVPSQIAGLKTDRYLNREFEVTLDENFYGRKKERERLSDSVKNRRRRLTILTALPRMGKSFLAYLIVQQQIELKNFDLVIYFAIEGQREQLTLTAHDLAKDILDNCFSGYDPHKNLIEELVRCFKTHRCLLVIDNFDVVFSVQNQQLLTFGEDNSYKQLIERLTFKPHQSHTVIVSRVFPQLTIRELSAVHSIELIPLEGMGFKDVESFLNSQGIDNITEDNVEELTEYMGGMPAEIATAISDMKEYHANKLKEFLASKSISKNVKAGIEKIFGDLLSAEEELLDRMISYGRPVSYPELEQDIKDIKKLGDERATEIFKNLKSIIDSLRGRSLIQSDDSPRYYIHPVVADIRLQFIIDRVIKEIQSPSGEMNYLNRFIFYKPASEESDLARQKENVFEPIVERIEESCQKKEVQEYLQKISKPNDNYYAAGNIFNILCEIFNGNLDDTNFEDLVIRHADARVVSSMQSVSLKDEYINKDRKIYLPVNEGNVNPSRLGCPDAIAFSPIEDRFAVGDADGNVRLWRYENDNRNWVEEDRVFCRHTGWIWSIKYSPDGKFILTGGDDGFVYLWNTNSKKDDPFVAFNLSGAIVSVAFSPDFCCDPDGNNKGLIAACSDDGAIEIRDVSNYFDPIDLPTDLKELKPKYIKFLPRQGSDLTGYTFAFMSSHNKGHVELWSLSKSEDRSYNFTKTKCFKHDRQIDILKFSSNGSLFAVGAVDGSVSLWSVVKGEKVADSPKKHDRRVGAIDFDRDDKMLASAGHDGKIILWNLENSSEANECEVAHEGKILGIAFSQKTGVLVSVSDDRTIKVWSLNLKVNWEQEIFQNSQLIQGSTKWIWSLATHPQKPIFAAACDDGRVVILKSEDNKLEKSITLTTDKVRTWAVAFHPNGKILATGGSDKDLKLWDWEKQTQLDEDLKGHNDPIRAITFSDDGKVIATASADSTVRLWELIDEDRGIVEPVVALKDKNSGEEVWTVAFGLEDKLLAKAGQDGKIYLHYFENGTEDILRVYKPDYKNPPKLITIHAHNDTIWSICFSPNNRWLASASSDCTIKLWEIDLMLNEKLKLSYTLSGNDSHVHAVCFDPQGEYLVASGNDRVIRVWKISKLKKDSELQQGEKNLPQHKENSHKGWIWALSRSSSGFISGAIDGNIKLWQFNSDDSRLALIDNYSNNLTAWVKGNEGRDHEGRDPP